MFLGHDEPTDVISFPLEEEVRLEGEVYVNLDRAKEQAKHFGVSFRNEVARLVIHGILHLVGYDDTTTEQARIMKSEEDRQLGFWFA
jgi:rRNA maturation RNase YbeY